MRARSPRAGAARAKHVAEPKEIAQNVFNVTETGRTPGCTGGAGDSGMAKTIVTLALFSIREHGVSFRGLFEFFFRISVSLIFVRMILMSETPVGAL